MGVLKAHRLAQQPLAPFVFASTDGTALDGTNVTHRLQGCLNAAGLPTMKFHDLRHGKAALMLASGSSMRQIMEQLGHSRIGVTMDTYTAVLPELQREAAERADAMLAVVS